MDRVNVSNGIGNEVVPPLGHLNRAEANPRATITSGHLPYIGEELALKNHPRSE